MVLSDQVPELEHTYFTHKAIDTTSDRRRLA